jgi:hypothetical protein
MNGHCMAENGDLCGAIAAPMRTLHFLIAHAVSTLLYSIGIVLLFGSCDSEAAITFVTDSKYSAVSAGSVQLTVPSSASANDLLLAVMVIENTATTISSTPTGWTLVGRYDQTLTFSDTNSRSLDAADKPGTHPSYSVFVYRKIASSSDPGNTSTWNLSSNRHVSAVMAVYRGIDVTDPTPFVSATVAGSVAAGVTAPNVTADFGGGLTVAFWAAGDFTGFEPTGYPTGFTVRRNPLNSSANNCTAMRSDNALTYADMSGPSINTATGTLTANLWAYCDIACNSSLASVGQCPSGSTQVYRLGGSGGTAYGIGITFVLRPAPTAVLGCVASGVYSSRYGTLRTLNATTGIAATNFNQGDKIRFQFDTLTAYPFTSPGAGFTLARQDTGSTIYNGVGLSQSGTAKYYDWQTAAGTAAGYYYERIRDSDSSPSAYGFATLGTPAVETIRLFSDIGRTQQSDTFKAGDVVYVTTYATSPDSFSSINSLRLYDFNNGNTTVTASLESSSTSKMLFHFTMPTTRMASGEWGTLRARINVQNTSRSYYRNIRRLDGTCLCTATAPNDLSGTAAATSITLTWTTNPGNSYYRVYRDGILLADNVASGSFIDNSVAPGNTYLYAVRGVGTAGCESVDSNAVSFTIVGNPGEFNAYDTDNSPALRIKTKVANTAFNLTVKPTNGAFTGAVKVELLDSHDNTGAYDATTGCRPTWSTVITSIGSVNVSGAGTTVGSFTANNVYKDVRVRISYPATGTATTIACSTDNFAIRPASFTAATGVSGAVTDSNWTTAGTSRDLQGGCTGCTNTHRAGQPFRLSTQALAGGSVMSNYNSAAPASASPVMEILQVMVPASCGPASAPVACDLGTLTEGTWSGSGTLTSTTANYDNVGVLNVRFRDDTWSNVDLADTAPDPAGSDLGRNFYSSAFNIGRFVPDRIDVVPNVPSLAAGCPNATANFTYLDQPIAYAKAPVITLTGVEALNGATTTNYQGTLWKVTAPAAPTYSASSGTLSVTGGAPVLASNADGTGTLTYGGSMAFTRPASPAVPFSPTITITQVLNVDTDNVPITVSVGATPYTASVALPFASIPHELRHGRVRLLNANGSELLDLPLVMKMEYWKDATSGWQLNNADSCTTIAATNFAFAFGGIGNNLTACKTAVSISGSAPNFSVSLAKPSSGNSGWTDVTVNLGSTPAGNTCAAVGVSSPAATTANVPWLQFNWTGTMGNPKARATFGVYKSGPVIHRRELY